MAIGIASPPAPWRHCGLNSCLRARLFISRQSPYLQRIAFPIRLSAHQICLLSNITHMAIRSHRLQQVQGSFVVGFCPLRRSFPEQMSRGNGSLGPYQVVYITKAQ
jgi:hypothetical protein